MKRLQPVQPFFLHEFFMISLRTASASFCSMPVNSLNAMQKYDLFIITQQMWEKYDPERANDLFLLA